jgi:hypothetical protein
LKKFKNLSIIFLVAFFVATGINNMSIPSYSNTRNITIGSTVAKGEVNTGTGMASRSSTACAINIEY